MRKVLRDVITLVREAGGSGVWISEGGRHTRVNFDMGGEPRLLLIHRGNEVSSRFAPMIRSLLRRSAA